MRNCLRKVNLTGSVQRMIFLSYQWAENMCSKPYFLLRNFIILHSFTSCLRSIFYIGELFHTVEKIFSKMLDYFKLVFNDFLSRSGVVVLSDQVEWWPVSKKTEKGNETTTTLIWSTAKTGYYYTATVFAGGKNLNNSDLMPDKEEDNRTEFWKRLVRQISLNKIESCFSNPISLCVSNELSQLTYKG